MAGTAAGSTVQGPSGPTKEQLVARIQELEQQVQNTKIKMKHPDTYYRDREKLEHFFRGLEVYFATCQRMSDVGKVIFTAALLQDAAASWFRPYMEGYTSTGGVNHQDIFRNYMKFKETIRNFFRDTDQQATLERRLMGLTQKKSASEYTAKFQQLALEVK
jgi:hypothetical protein